jgi:hypothetical protein
MPCVTRSRAWATVDATSSQGAVCHPIRTEIPRLEQARVRRVLNGSHTSVAPRPDSRTPKVSARPERDDSETKVPEPTRRSTRPSRHSSDSARAAVGRDTLNRIDTWCSLRNLSPGLSARRSLRSSSTIAEYFDLPMTGGIATIRQLSKHLWPKHG